MTAQRGSAQSAHSLLGLASPKYVLRRQVVDEPTRFDALNWAVNAADCVCSLYVLNRGSRAVHLEIEGKEGRGVRGVDRDTLKVQDKGGAGVSVCPGCSLL